MKRWIPAAILALGMAAPAPAPAAQGYYRFPSLHGDTLVFTAEGDLWTVGVQGGVARRITTNPASEGNAAISPDGRTLAFVGAYEGPAEVYTMPLAGGLPERRTFDGGGATVVGWSPQGRIVYATRRFSTLPATQLVTIDPASGTRDLLALSQASEATWSDDGRTLVFTRLPFQGSFTRRYKGGTAQNLWKLAPGAAEAVPLTADYPGTSKSPMFWQGRIYFASDRDGTMNLWSMDLDGHDLKQLTTHDGYDLQNPCLSEGRVAYQYGADLWLYDIASGRDSLIPIEIASDFDQTREKWIKDPMEYVTTMHLSPDGDRVVMTVRGEIFTVPAGGGRIVEATRNKLVRYRSARFMPDGKSILALSDETGEVEFWKVPANGVGQPEPVTHDGKVLRWEGVPSPDGKWIAHYDKNQELWVYSIAAGKQTLVATCRQGDFATPVWSPDSQWLAFSLPGDNLFQQIKVYNVSSGRTIELTTDRWDSYSPAWSPDGRWMYFLSDRHYQSVVSGTWEPRQAEPFFDRTTQIFEMALATGLRSPFQPPDELHPAEKKDQEAKKDAGKDKPAVTVTIDPDGIEQRIAEVPVPSGNYEALTTDGKRLYWLAHDAAVEPPKKLMSVAIDSKAKPPEAVMEDVRDYELSADGKKLLVRKKNDVYVFDAGAKAPAELAESALKLKDWSFALVPREEWRQMFREAWRLERDYFYDPRMHGLDWPSIRDKYQPLVDRITSREELSDILGQMVSELSALHIFVRGGDMPRSPDQVMPASLGARFTRDDGAGGWKVAHIYQTDPDLPAELSPLLKPGVGVKEGDVIRSINGVSTLSVSDPGALLENQADRQVLLTVATGGATRDVVVVPVAPIRDADLRYDEWEYSRRLLVDRLGGGKLGYVHLRAMGRDDFAQWAREFYPVFKRDGLIVDVRNNRGGNIDSYILEKLMRKAWFYWQPRVGDPDWNMHYAFRGPVVVLCNEYTASDGEAFSEGFRRLGLGKVIGTRTWGGEIWLSSSNFLVDKGIATAAETGVYGPGGEWLIEGHGVDPDIVVDNLPRATFDGKDAQIEAAVQYLQQEIQAHPVITPPAPAYPDKSLRRK